MEAQVLTRKLTTILHADVEGYSRLIEADEEATLRILTPSLQVMKELVHRHGGKSIGSRGDSLLAEFPSVRSAVQCAIEMQHELTERNAALPVEQRIAFRMGLHVGEIVEDGEQLHGDGINIAVRVEGLAEAGGICLSEAVYQQVKTKLPLRYEDLGPQQLKNITEPVRVYRLVRDTAEAVRREALTGHLYPFGTPRRRTVAIAATGLLLIGGAVVTLLSPPFSALVTRHSTLVTEEAQPPVLPLPDKPSIVVLPFVNLSGDPTQEYFSDGITEVLTGDLSQISSLFVIARHSAFTYKGRAVKVQDVSRALGVRYALEGSVQKAGGRVRISAQLIDATTGGHLWAERYERPLQDLFALQDEIVQQIVATLKLQLTLWEQGVLVRKFTDNVEAYDYHLRGLEYFWRTTKAANIQARQMFEKAVVLDPQYAEAYARLGLTYWAEWIFQWNPDPQNLEQAYALAQKAVVLDDTLPRVRNILGITYLYRKQFEQAKAEFERALALDPNFADAYVQLGSVFLSSNTERAEEAVELIEKGIRLNPRQPLSINLNMLGLAYIALGRYEEAIVRLQQALSRNPQLLFAHVNLAIAYSELGREEEARAEVATILRLNPNFSLEGIKQTYAVKDPTSLERYLAALRKAGLK